VRPIYVRPVYTRPVYTRGGSSSRFARQYPIYSRCNALKAEAARSRRRRRLCGTLKQKRAAARIGAGIGPDHPEPATRRLSSFFAASIAVSSS
jgi:hypothetical protein